MLKLSSMTSVLRPSIQLHLHFDPESAEGNKITLSVLTYHPLRPLNTVAYVAYLSLLCSFSLRYSMVAQDRVILAIAWLRSKQITAESMGMETRAHHRYN